MEVERRARGRAPARYRPRHPSRSLLYRCVQQHLESLLAQRREHHDDESVPEHVEREFRRYLECASQSVPAGPGWGWRVSASDDPAQRLQAGTVFNSNYTQLTAEANAGGNTNAVRVGANGSLGWMQGLAFFSRRIDQGAFAVVHVGDVEGVSVSLSNQVTATTNGSGLALVTGLLPYQLNQLTVDPDLLPLDIDVGGVRQSVIPYARSGVFIDFPIKRSRNALVVLQQPGGEPVPAGARVTVTPGNQEFIVARRGEVYLMDVQDDNHIDVRWKDGGCSLPLPVPPAPAGGEAPRIGPLTCGSVQ